ncbi:MAG: hypothetical protein A2V59_04795 [Armatimonadetes bacterium RBG_19FT_COMBO_69_19]|nr:MAG: hypothetical protein A2V59_04795 [Armatimonadetes bacterium RBG_19FT_COMBO_69_19]
MKAVAWIVAGLVVLGFMVVLIGTERTTAGPAVQGCPACHGVAGKQPALDAAAKAIKGHPASAAKTVQQCALCHTKGPTPAPFRTGMHKIHLNSAKFTAAKGTCTSCHSVDKATGTVTVFGLERK